jgi:hypothetical protein
MALAEGHLGLKELELAKLHLELAKQKAAQGEPVDTPKLTELESLMTGPTP